MRAERKVCQVQVGPLLDFKGRSQQIADLKKAVQAADRREFASNGEFASVVAKYAGEPRSDRLTR